ncbi:AAA family ATPase [Arthrobacter sp. ISL-48]|uniref:AAA family ATPase n=1 Tax=Arthrobacter sp. ISL-48 TaxID=2819110 RepID=UPI001BE54396|nr:AAA family ATPase [Arthrobacter sp. ISL-48]MBT2532733.1 AAA family ATPase [Arthrobacter sp. ISL-48]
MLIVLTGIDGAGKSTAARALVSAAQTDGRDALLLSNHAGRRSMSVLAAKLVVRWPPRLADAIETSFRVVNVLVSHARARRFQGMVVMDRHLFCQLALRKTKDLPRGRLLPWLIGALPAPDAIVHLDIAPELAHQRIVARGTDAETLSDLVSLRDAYRSLPEYPDFVELDAAAPPAEVASRLAQLVSQGSRAAGQQGSRPGLTADRGCSCGDLR